MAAPLTLEIFPLHRAIAPTSNQTTHVLARIRADRAAPRDRPALTAVLVLDVSGSMQGEPIAQVLRSAERLAGLLSDTDRLGVVTFNEGALTTSAIRRLDAQARHDIKRELGAVAAGGNTNISGALAHAALLMPKRGTGERQLLLLMSDGEPNVGATKPSALGDQARLIKDRDVAVSTLGFGASHNDDVLVAIADGGGGRYAYVVDAKLAESSFVRAVGAQLDVVAEEVRLLLAPADGVEIVRVLDAPPTTFGAGGLRVTLPDMLAGDELNVVIELKVLTPRETGLWRPLRVTLSGRLAGTTERFALQDAADLTVSHVGPFDTDTTAHAALGIALADEVRTEARRLAERGNYPAAAAALRKAQAVLAAIPGFTAGAAGPLNDAYETLADEILVMDAKPRAQEYQRYKKASRDYLDFAQSGAKSRSGGSIGLSSAPSANALLARARANLKMPTAFLQVLSGPLAGTRLPLDTHRFVIGRGVHGNDLVLPDNKVSRQHTLIELLEDGFWVIDMGSTGGTSVNGKPTLRARLSHKDTLEIGGNILRYEQP